MDGPSGKPDYHAGPSLGLEGCGVSGLREGLLPITSIAAQVLLPLTPQQNMTLDTCRWSPETTATEKAQPPGRSCSGFWRVTDRDLSTPMNMYACARTHRHTQIDAHTHTYMSMHSHTHRHTYTHTYVNTHTYMSIYTAPQLQAPCFQHHCCLGFFLPTPYFQLTWL